MIIREEITTYDGRKLIKTYSSLGYMIKKVGTTEIYCEAVDVEVVEYEEMGDVIDSKPSFIIPK